MHIRTNNNERQFIYRHDVPADILASDFDWLGEDDGDGYILYRGNWMHLSQFERIPPGVDELAKWDGYAEGSYSTGTVIKVSSDGETYKIGSYMT